MEKSTRLLTYCPVFRLSALSSCLHSILKWCVCNFCERIFKSNPHWQPTQGLLFFKDNIIVAAQFSKRTPKSEGFKLHLSVVIVENNNNIFQMQHTRIVNLLIIIFILEDSVG